MNSSNRFSIDDTRQIIDGLRDLGDVTAPRSLLGAVLAEAGLADGYWRTESPIGRVYVAFNPRGVSAVMTAGDDEAFERAFDARFHRPVHPVSAPPAQLARRVARQISGEKEQALSYDLRGLTEFQRAVLLKALEIPRGEVRPYSWVAREIGRPGAVRAVGTVLANNPVPLLIPCHRVVRSDGRTGDYAFGREAKQAILRQEGIQIDELEGLALQGVRYYGSDTTRVYCLPTCRHARRITAPHRVPFESAAAAAAAGYRPCQVCRPAISA